MLSSLLATGVVRSQEPPANDRDASAIRRLIDALAEPFKEYLRNLAPEEVAANHRD